VTQSEVVELVDLVDDDDRIIGVAPRTRMRAQNLRHRAVFVAVRSTAGDVLVHRRSDAKDVWPGWWDLAVGGVVAHGEAWDAAARRELREEIGLADASLRRLGGGSFADDDVRLIGRVYSVVCDGPFTFDDGEVVEAHFISRNDLVRRIAAQRFLPDSVALVLPRL
jgi:isopentenyldiphosphate isomerase